MTLVKKRQLKSRCVSSEPNRALHKEAILSKTAIYLYFVAIFFQLYIVCYNGRTYLPDLVASVPAISFLVALIREYLYCLYFAVLLIDLYANGLSKARLIFGLMATCLIVINGNEGRLMPVIWATWLIIAFPRNLKLSSAVSFVLFSNIFFVVTTLALSFLGILPDHTQFQHDEFRHSYGFVVPNALGMSVTFIVLIWSMMKANTWGVRHFLLVFGVLILTYSACDSRGAVIVCAALAIILSIRACLKKRKTVHEHYCRIIYGFSCIIVPLVALFSVGGVVFLSHFEDAHFFSTLSNLLNQRLVFAINFYHEYGFHLLGQDVEFVSEKVASATGKSWSGVDGAFIQSALLYGLLITFFYAILEAICAFRNAKLNMSFGFAAFTICFSIYCITENIFWDAASNITFLLIGYMLSNSLLVSRAPTMRFSSKSRE